jgi:hypothetical protein
MRTLMIAAVLLFATAASAEESGERAPSFRLAQYVNTAAVADSEKLAPPRHGARWEQDELVGDALGGRLGIHNGRWEMDDGARADGGPIIGGTFKKGAAIIQLRWKSDE